ncbi:hypothetical protein [Pseudolysinimonas sp.]|uniref:hypothetical protein n=1 Tax=Pseudolysinimonas sp. TaxID=2680009 RepID=UPI00286BB239|nr:hypothetical protein [Pseudolysinimonas sp.]
MREDPPTARGSVVDSIVTTHLIEGERIVLDVVFIAGILALVALVAAVGKGAERL